ncbi:MAG: nucleotidyl transferase AbiEii/AbiGii toxin family protein [Acidobacteria bacterium]|nr:nucleotidyl transferase AbiEii/AbiGii toxin family protein [Candidatus Sulfomarinibacter sp. MAG AM1]
MSTGLDRLQRDLLEAFFAREQRFFLTGGAALVGFYLHHRQTLDLDLFTTEDHLEDGEAALFDAARELGATVERLRTSTSFRRFLVSRGDESVVADIVRDFSPQIDTEKPVRDGIRIDSPREIMANKLCTLLSRGELRDLVDVMALEQAGYGVEEHLALAARKDAGLTPAQLGWVLSQLEIGEDASPPGGVSADELRGYLDELVRRLSEVAYPE